MDWLLRRIRHSEPCHSIEWPAIIGSATHVEQGTERGMLDAGCAEPLVTAAAELREHFPLDFYQPRARRIVEKRECCARLGRHCGTRRRAHPGREQTDNR